MEILFLIGRILFGGFFLLNAYNHLFKSQSLVGYTQSKGVPFPRFAVFLTGVFLLFGSLSILSGFMVVEGVALLVLFLIPVTFEMHAFWKAPINLRQMEMVQFTKNMAILGGLIMLLMIPTPWPMAL